MAGLRNSNSGRKPLSEKDLLAGYNCESDKRSVAAWESREEFVVSDVFAPQGVDDVNDNEDFGDAVMSADDGNLEYGELPMSGFRMSTTSGMNTPLKGYSTPTGEGQKKRRKKKNKKKLDKLDKLNAALAEQHQPFSALKPLSAFKTDFDSRSSSMSGGVSALSLQLEALNVDSSQYSESDASKRDSSDSERTEILTSYEIPLDNDFISPDAITTDEGNTLIPKEEDNKSAINRKMCASDFKPLTCLGKGTFGTVLLVKQKTSGALYAQKQFKKASLTVQKRLVEQTKTERAILESVNRHPFVVKLFYAFQDHEKLYLILEYAQGGELFTHLAMERMFSEDAASFYMAEMVLALEHLHHNVGVIYRDLKPENCLLDAEGHLLLTDFGLSKVAVGDDDRCNSSLGTIEYMAPEVIQGKPYGKACDWWSLGALGFDLLTGSPPFRGNNHAKIIEKIQKQKLMVPYYVGPDAKDLLIRLLRKDPNKRLGYHQPKDMRTIKSHRFFRKINWQALERRELEPPIKPIVTDPALAENFSVDFTSLSLSPEVTSSVGAGFGHRVPRTCGPGDFVDELDCDEAIEMGLRGTMDDNPFGGFSFVASSSLLESTINFCH